ncbi:hypothetical protein HHK36_020308 [Tetracentron sinense]|uniref:DUF4283 domain-containing protein n=1 Tax=Tetracentron sinense TaxID=13715 RepID=A0A834YX73_TETSI|nr:hypothetical protein HHK36_020308 [Tetracentron sinense]
MAGIRVGSRQELGKSVGESLRFKANEGKIEGPSPVGTDARRMLAGIRNLVGTGYPNRWNKACGFFSSTFGSSSSALDGSPFPQPIAKYEDVIADPELFMVTLRELHVTMKTNFIVGGGSRVRGKTHGVDAQDFLELYIVAAEKGAIVERFGIRRREFHRCSQLKTLKLKLQMGHCVVQITREKKWKDVADLFDFDSAITNTSFVLWKNYISMLQHYEYIYYLGAQGRSYPSVASPSSVGCPVTGVIDGEFKDCYLATVTVGTKKLRGVVFQSPEVPQHPVVQHAASEETWNWDKEEKIKENQIEIEEQEVDHGEQNQENMRQTISTPAPCASSSIVRRSPDARLITPEACLYVDDLLFTGNSQEMFDKFKHAMFKEFEMTDCGLMSYFLGIEVYKEQAAKDTERFATEMEAYKERLRAGSAAPIQQRPSAEETDKAARVKSFAEVAKASRSLVSENINITKTIAVFQGEPALFLTLDESAKLAAPLKLSLVAKYSYGRPSFPAIREFFKLNYHLKFDYHIGVIDSRHLLIRFSVEEDYLTIYLKEYCYINGLLLRFIKWTPNFSAGIEPSIVPVWISLPNLPLHLFQEQILRSIGSAAGKVLCIDGPTKMLTRPNKVRLCVDLDITKSKPSHIWLGIGAAGRWQQIIYEKEIAYCSYCSRQGHSELVCRLALKHVHGAEDIEDTNKDKENSKEGKKIWVRKEKQQNLDFSEDVINKISEHSEEGIEIDKDMDDVPLDKTNIERENDLEDQQTGEEPSEETIIAPHIPSSPDLRFSSKSLEIISNLLQWCKRSSPKRQKCSKEPAEEEEALVSCFKTRKATKKY